MANIINFLKDTKPATSSTSTISTDTQTTKDKPSLFDSLLTNNQNQAEVKSSTISTTEVTQDKTQIVSEEEVNKTEQKSVENKDVLKTVENKNVEVKAEEVNVDNKEEVKSTSSLLDRLIIEAKKDIKTVSEEELKNLNLKTDVNQAEAKASTSSTTEVAQNKTQTPSEEEVNKTEQKSVENKDVLKSTNSLLDRLIIEAKKDVKTVSEEELKNLNLKTDVSVVVSKVVDEVVLTQTPNEEVEVNKTIIVSTQSTEPVSILTNTTLADETKNSSLPTNVDIKLNVLNETVSSTPMDTKISLMDQLIQKNIENTKTINSSDKIDFLQKETLSKDFISSIYLGSQKNSINNQELFNKNEAINLLKDASSLNDVKTSAGMLDLGLENIDVDVEQSLDLTTKLDLNKKIDLDLATRRNIIDNLILSKNIKSEDIKGLITKSVEASSALLDNTLQLADDAIVTVNSPLSYNIQSKIIGARQQMSTMMSDIAKQMYENYKPPVTVFKINLNPLELGSIAILMKSDKNNALSISMNVSSNSTLDALVENQNVLRNSLNKTFDENTKFNLDFSSSNQNSNQSNNQNNQGNQNKFDQQMDTQSVLQLKEENKDREEKSIDYM